MNKISSKFLNMEGLAALVESSRNKSNFNGVLLLTNAGMIIGNLTPVFSNTDVPTAAELVYDYKESYIQACIDNNENFEIMGDGSLLVVKDAMIKSNNGPLISLDEITVHCDSIIGFSPINIEEFKSQI